MSRCIFIIISHFLVFSAVVLAQEKPTLNTVQYDPSIPSHRQNVCYLHDKYYRREVELRHALRGLEIRPLLDENGGLFALKDGALNPDDPGLVPILLDEIAKRAGFSWRNSFAVTQGPGEGYDYTDLLLWGIEYYDFVADWFVNSLERLELGVGFPKGYYDGSFILVGKDLKNSGEGESVNLFSWLEPFTYYIWLLIILTMILSGIYYMFLENMEKPDKPNEWFFTRNIYYSFLLFSQHFNFEPKSHSARLFSVSFAFWSMIVIATYTANLTSFFVAKAAPGLGISSIEEAVRDRYPICVTQGYAPAAFVQREYPNGIYVEKPTEEAVFHGVTNGDCTFALSSMTTWEKFQNQRSTNGNCDLVWIGRVVKFVDAGFAVKTDAGIKCTSLIQDVLNLYLVEMSADGFIETAWNDYLRKGKDIECRVVEEIDAAPEQLTLREAGGAFFLLLLATVVSLIMTLFSRQRLKRKEQERSNNTIKKNNKNRTSKKIDDMRQSYSEKPNHLFTTFRKWKKKRKKKIKVSPETRLLLQKKLIDLNNDLRTIENLFFNDQIEERKQMALILSMMDDNVLDASTSGDC